MINESVLQDVRVRERSLLKNVYLWMAAALAVSAFTAFGVASSESLIRFFLMNRAMPLVLMVAEFAIVMALGAALGSMSRGTAIGLFMVYAVLNGVMLSSVLLVYAQATVFKAFFSAALMFLGMSIYATTTKRDLNNLGYYLMISLWGLVVASLLNVFFRSSGADFLLSIVGVLIFAGLTAYDTQNIARANSQYGWQMDQDTFSKLGVIFALELYLDFLNIFLYLLRIFSGNRRD